MIAIDQEAVDINQVPKKGAAGRRSLAPGAEFFL
jgi:hypothetical protein